jgi:putative ABC transport system permease protein
MFRNYVKVALRHLFKNKTFSIINILGLSVGVACCALLALYIQDEFSYEKHFPGHERVYRITTTFVKDDKVESFPRSSPPIAMDMVDVLPEVEIATRSVNPPDVEQHLVRYQDKVFYEKKGVLVDSTFFEVFPAEFATGDPATALDQPSTVVLTDKLATKIFGKKDPIDELLIINSGRAVDTFRVSGVLKSNALRSHTTADFYMAMHSDGWGKYVNSQTTWAWNNFVSSYVRLKSSTLPSAVEEKMANLLQQKAGSDLKNAGLKKELHLQPLDDVRLYSNFSDSFGDTGSGNIVYVYILASIGIFILLIACINFMNLTTAKASQRAGEVGIRKSMGAYKANLIGQFLGESFTIVFTSLALSLVLVVLTLPVINQVTAKDMSINTSNVLFLLGAMAVIGIITGLLAGSYPAFFLSSFQPAQVLKNKSLSGDGSSILRKGLVVFQFVIAITLISSIFIIQKQFSFIRNKALGFDYEKRVMIPLRSQDSSGKYATLRDELKRVPGVEDVSGASSLPSTVIFQDWLLYSQGSTMEKGILHRVINVDERYFQALNVKLLAGRDFIAASDTFSYVTPNNKVIVNEASLKSFNLTLENALGAKLFTEWENVVRSHEVIGVVNDFHQSSLHQPIVPLMFVVPAGRIRYNYILATLEGADVQAIQAGMRSVWEKIVPTIPFECQFLSESVNKQYESDDRISIMLTWSTLLAIIISCMGLYGLSVYVAERKVKEIGIRKVLGASVGGIVGMLTKDFIQLVMIAFVLAVPLAWYAMDRWLQTFAYKVEPGWMVFGIAGAASFLIAFVTVGFESVKAAIDNPIKALRTE